MKIIDRMLEDRVNISFEVFPPKTDDAYDKVVGAVDEIAKVKPSFISVTYGAGGGTSKNTVKIAAHIQNDLGVDSIAHLTCVSSSKDEVHRVVSEIKESGIQNILALRGDIPKDASFPISQHYKYASELIEDLKSMGDFCIGAACYPEGHVESTHKAEDTGQGLVPQVLTREEVAGTHPGHKAVDGGEQVGGCVQKIDGTH